ncbi:MAG: hypothetical protein WDO14_13575 [Bacteroidota bacterium]
MILTCMNRRAFAVLISLLFLASFVSAQEIPVQATNPTLLKWYEVKTPHFKVLFPKGFEEQAMRVANTLEFIREPEAVSMGVKPRPISVILQNQSSVSNAFVTMGPRRSEFYTMPPQNPSVAGTNDWLNLLASHEYRHVVQFQRSIVGFNKFVYYIFGQQALSLTAFAAAPQWFWEGDAVATETAFTQAGRGRIPNFNLVLRTNFLEGRTFNYQKQYVRSYKHNITDHYVLGYHMITYLRNRTNDADIWDKIVKRSWSNPYIPFAFSRAIRKETGMGVSKLFNEMADSLRNGWTKQVESLKLTDFNTLNRRISGAYLDYLYPQQMENGDIVAIITGIGQISRVVTFKPGSPGFNEKFTTGPLNDGGMLSTAKGKVVWNEYRFDPRWTVKNFTVVKGFDAYHLTNKDLSKRSRYAGAAISPDGTKVVTVESTSDYKATMLVIDYNSKAILKKFDNPNNDWIIMPRWTPDGQSIVAVRLSKEGKKVSLYNYETGSVTDLMDAGNENVGHPVMSRDGKYLFYNSPYSGIDNIYALEISSGKKLQVTSSKYGAYNPFISVDGKTIIYNDQSRNGMDIVSARYDPSAWKDISELNVPQSHFYDKLVSQESHPDIISEVPKTQFPVSRYKYAKGLVNVHSWGPYFESDITQPSFGVSSRNLLGTTVIDAGYKFDINERTGSYYAGVSYQGFYPILDFNVLSGKRQANSSALNTKVLFDWKETTVTGGVRIPLLLTRSKYNVNLTLKNWVGFTQVTGFTHEATRNGSIYKGTDRIVHVNDSLRFVFDQQVGDGRLLYNEATLSFSRTLKQSRRDFNPRFAQLLDIESYTTPYGGDFKGKLTVVRGSFYFPGILKHHSLLIRGGYQVGTSSLDVNRYSFRNRVFRPRGFSYPFDSEFRSFSTNYALPLLYPDLQFGPVLNIQRLRVNLFYDIGQAVGSNYFYSDKGAIYYSTSNRNYQSTGAEFTVDVNIMRLLQQLNFGLRTTLINPDGAYPRKWVVEFVLGTLNF